ncbi:DinB family protein [Clostridium sp. DJ247]|uniref:DinB family protein n=1 Tax=Clostridium sp. DJ247 TaxID=2726188 RepID=UPI001623F66A|nr:DinB family protein [Clostridium sp. DJ247]MBC2578773.1 DinB family protein [Clostridium sp. DJ247]
MDSKKGLWNSQQKLLKSIMMKLDKFDETIKLCLDQHSMVHISEMSQTNVVTFEDELWEGLDEITFRTMPTAKDEATIAWCLWHSTRIEDITMNILVADDTQVINSDNWLEKMNVKIYDTGNAMTNEEIIDFSLSIDIQELRNYRKVVGRKTREIIKKFEPSDLKRKMEANRLQRVLDEGGVLNVEGANWLIDFWGRKNVAGILLMPVTRHHIVHINESIQLKQKCRKLGRK